MEGCIIGRGLAPSMRGKKGRERESETAASAARNAIKSLYLVFSPFLALPWRVQQFAGMCTVLYHLLRGGGESEGS